MILPKRNDEPEFHIVISKRYIVSPMETSLHCGLLSSIFMLTLV